MRNYLIDRDYLTDWEVIPFHLIKNNDFLPAVKHAIQVGKKEIERIIQNPESPNFNNTILALDMAGIQLDEIASVFFNLLSAESNDEMQEIAQQISPILTDFHNDILLNTNLFHRIQAVYKMRNQVSFAQDELHLLEDTYRHFVRNGALLDESQKQRFRCITRDLAQLSLKFDDNCLKATNQFELHIKDLKQLNGLPDFVLEMAKEEAESRQKKGWLFTLHAPNYLAFMQYAENRELREKMYRAKTSLCAQADNNDNRDIIKSIVNLRIELSSLFEHKSFASYALVERMAKDPKTVNEFLEKLGIACKNPASSELSELQEFAQRQGFKQRIMPWDFAFYSEILKQERYHISDEQTKAYFRLENTENAVFELAHTLYGIKFTFQNDIPVYHKDAKAFIVTDLNDEYLGVLYMDYFPRSTKQSGAWMTNYKEQYVSKSTDYRPHISVVCNFSKPTKSKPSLISFDELTTLLHEFGHALHGLFSRVRFRSQSGTNVARDFVELPSQFMENFAYQKQWLKTVTKHYLTGEAMPNEMIDSIIAAGKFHAASACLRQISLGITDMAWHSLEADFEGNPIDFEQKQIANYVVLPQIEGAAISPAFGHIFAGGYAAGYYSYKWAEVLDADAFERFLEEGLFNAETAQRFRKEILERGSSRDEMESFIAFKGRQPDINALLKRDGLL
jgi:peptidyl-dipeptidase Dcp